MVALREKLEPESFAKLALSSIILCNPSARDEDTPLAVFIQSSNSIFEPNQNSSHKQMDNPGRVQNCNPRDYVSTGIQNQMQSRPLFFIKPHIVHRKIPRFIRKDKHVSMVKNSIIKFNRNC